MAQLPDSPAAAAPSRGAPFAFDPVPARARKNRWTAERQCVLSAVLLAKRCVQAATVAVGMSWESAYRFRARPGAASFAAAWDAALATRVHGGFDRTCKPIMHRGQRVGTLVRPDNAVLLELFGPFERLTQPGSGRGPTPHDGSSR